jgi:hypothetical protein
MTSTAIAIAFGLTAAALQVCIAAIIFRRRIGKRFLFFWLYTTYSVVAAVLMTLTATYAGRRTYAETYYVVQGGYTLLALLAMHESFHKSLKSYYFQKAWFRLAVPVIAFAILALSTVKLLRHAPIEAGKITMVYISFDFAANYMLAGIFGLFAVLVLWRQVQWKQYTFGIMRGFGLFSIISTLVDFLRSDFGTKMNVFFSYAPAVAYILSCLIWLGAFMEPEPPRAFGHPASPIDLNELQAVLRRIRRVIK